MVRVEIEAKIRRSVALILMKHDDYVGARNKLLSARKSYPGLYHIDELIKVCDIVCAAESGSGIDWYRVLQINKTASESDIEFKYTELVKSLEPVKNKFPDIQSALALIKQAYSVFSGGGKCYEFDCKTDGSVLPCGSVKPLDMAHSDTVNINRGVTSKCSSGTKRIVNEGLNETDVMCNSMEQPMKSARNLGGDDCEVIAEAQSPGEVKGGDEKLIIICQAGGEFVTNEDGSLSYNNNGGDAHAMDIDKETKFDDFVLEIAGMWKYSPETMTIKYILPGHGKALITVSNDEDMRRMVKFHGNSTTVDVFVTMGDVIHHDASKMPASRTVISEAAVPIDDTPVVEGIIMNSVEPDPVYDVPLESTSSNQPPAIALTAASAKHHRAVDLENRKACVYQRETNVHELGETSGKYSEKKFVRVKLKAALKRMKNNDYAGARTKLYDARITYPELEYIDELIRVCDILCTAEVQLQGSGIDWYSVVQNSKPADESDIEFRYKELIRILEPVKNIFPEIESALGLIEKAFTVLSNREKRYEFDWRRAGSSGLCGSVKPLESDRAHSETVRVNRAATSQSSSGTERNVCEGSEKSNVICNSPQQPLKRVRSLCGEASNIEHTETVNIKLEPTSQSLSGTRRIVSEGSDKSNLICNSPKQRLKKEVSSLYLDGVSGNKEFGRGKRTSAMKKT